MSLCPFYQNNTQSLHYLVENMHVYFFFLFYFLNLIVVSSIYRIQKNIFRYFMLLHNLEFSIIRIMINGTIYDETYIGFLKIVKIK